MKVWIIGYYDAYDKEDFIKKIVDSKEKAIEFCEQNSNEFFKYYYDEIGRAHV